MTDTKKTDGDVKYFYLRSRKGIPIVCFAYTIEGDGEHALVGVASKHPCDAPNKSITRTVASGRLLKFMTKNPTARYETQRAYRVKLDPGKPGSVKRQALLAFVTMPCDGFSCRVTSIAAAEYEKMKNFNDSPAASKREENLSSSPA